MKDKLIRILIFSIIPLWILYNYLYDTTRVSHPNYVSGDYERCIQSADTIYRDNLSRAIADPSIWRLGGYESAQDFANASQNLAVSRCR